MINILLFFQTGIIVLTLTMNYINTIIIHLAIST